MITEAVGRLYPEDPPAFLARTPHGHGSVAEIEADVAAAALRSRFGDGVIEGRISAVVVAAS